MPEFVFPGGINELNDEFISTGECISGQNFELEVGNSQFQARKPFDLKVTEGSAREINGLCQLIDRSDTSSTIVIADTQVYEWDGTSSLGTAVTTVTTGGNFISEAWQLDQTIAITDLNKVNVIKRWDGTTFGNMISSGGTNTKAKYAKAFNNRMWYANVNDNSVDLPHVIVASAFENPRTIDPSTRGKGQDSTSSPSTANVAFFLTTPDLKEINGFDVFNEKLIVSTVNGRIYEITGTDATNYNIIPLYAKSNAIGEQAFVNIGNDWIWQRRGAIESLRAVETSGDVQANDLSISIPETIETLGNTKMVYDESRQKVYMFGTNKCLTLYKHLIGSELSPWVPFTTTHDSLFNATSVAYMRAPDGTDYSVYWGDTDGNIFKMDGTGEGDAGSEVIEVRRKLPLIQIKGKSVEGRVKYRRRDEVDLTLALDFSDEFYSTTSTIKLKQQDQSPTVYGGAFYYGGAVYYGTTTLLGAAQQSQGFSPGGIGSSAFLELSLDTDKEFLIDSLFIEE